MNALYDPAAPVPDDPEAGYLYDEIIMDGWVEVDGCWLLAALAETYHGSRDHFTDLTGYEGAVNGRGIPDDGLPTGIERAARLVHRGLAFARRALAVLPDDAPSVTAFVSAGVTPFDETVFTGYVRFCADHDGESPYVRDIEEFDRGILLVRSAPAGPIAD